MFSHYHGRLAYQTQRGGGGGEAKTRLKYDALGSWSSDTSCNQGKSSSAFRRWDNGYSNDEDLRQSIFGCGHVSTGSIPRRLESVSYGVTHSDCPSYYDTNELQQPRINDWSVKAGVHLNSAVDHEGYESELDDFNILDETKIQCQMLHNGHLDHPLLGNTSLVRNRNEENLNVTLEDPESWIPRRPLVKERTYHFSVIYNHAQCPLSKTEDTDLATKVTRALVERLELKGYVNSYYHDRDHRPNNSLTKELERVLALSSVTILLLTPGFLRHSMEHYLDISVFRNLLFNLPSHKRLIVLGVGITKDQIPFQLQNFDILFFRKDWEVDVPAWNRFENVMKDELSPHLSTKWQSSTWGMKEPIEKLGDNKTETGSTLFQEESHTLYGFFEEKNDPKNNLGGIDTVSESDRWWDGVRSSESDSQYRSSLMDTASSEGIERHADISGHKFRTLLGRQANKIASKNLEDFIQEEVTKTTQLKTGVRGKPEESINGQKNDFNCSNYDALSSVLNENESELERLTIKYGSIWDSDEGMARDGPSWTNVQIVEGVRDHCDEWEIANKDTWNMPKEEWREMTECNNRTESHREQDQLCNGGSLEPVQRYRVYTEIEETGKLYLPDGWTIDDEQETWIMDAISNWSSFDIRDYWALSHMYHWWVPEESIKRREISEMQDLGRVDGGEVKRLSDQIRPDVCDVKPGKTNQSHEWDDHTISQSSLITSRDQGVLKERERKAANDGQDYNSVTTDSSGQHSLHGDFHHILEDEIPRLSSDSDYNLPSGYVSIKKDEESLTIRDKTCYYMPDVKTTQSLDVDLNELHLSEHEAQNLPSDKIQHSQRTSSQYLLPQRNIPEASHSYDRRASYKDSSGINSGSQDVVTGMSQNSSIGVPKSMDTKGPHSKNVKENLYPYTVGSYVDDETKTGDFRKTDSFSIKRESGIDNKPLSASVREKGGVKNIIPVGELSSTQNEDLIEPKTKPMTNSEKILIDSTGNSPRFSSPSNHGDSHESSTLSHNVQTVDEHLRDHETSDNDGKTPMTVIQSIASNAKVRGESPERGSRLTDTISRSNSAESPSIVFMTSTTQSSMQIKISVPSISDSIQTTVRFDTSSQPHREVRKDNDVIKFRLEEGTMQSLPCDNSDEGEALQPQDAACEGEREASLEINDHKDVDRTILPTNDCNGGEKTDFLTSSPNESDSIEKQVLLQMDRSSEQHDSFTKTETVVKQVEMAEVPSQGDDQYNAESDRVFSNNSHVGTGNRQDTCQDNQTRKEELLQSQEDVSGSYNDLGHLDGNVVAYFLSEEMLLANLNNGMNNKCNLNKEAAKIGKTLRVYYTETSQPQDVSHGDQSETTSKDATVTGENHTNDGTMISPATSLVIETNTTKDNKNTVCYSEDERPGQTRIIQAEQFRTESTAVNSSKDPLASDETQRLTDTHQTNDFSPEVHSLSCEADTVLTNFNQSSSYLQTSQIEDVIADTEVVTANKDLFVVNWIQTLNHSETDLAQDLKDDSLGVTVSEDTIVSDESQTPDATNDLNVETQAVSDNKGGNQIRDNTETEKKLDDHTNKPQPEDLNVETNRGVESMAGVEEINFSFSSEEFLGEGIEDYGTETERKVCSDVDSYPNSETRCLSAVEKNGEHNNMSDGKIAETNTYFAFGTKENCLGDDLLKNDRETVSINETIEDLNSDKDETDDEQYLCVNENNEENVSRHDEKGEHCMSTIVNDKEQNIQQDVENEHCSLLSGDGFKYEENAKVVEEKNEEGNVAGNEQTGNEDISVEASLGLSCHWETETGKLNDKTGECKQFANGEKEDNYRSADEDKNKDSLYSYAQDEETIFSSESNEYEDRSLCPEMKRDRQMFSIDEKGGKENQTIDAKHEECCIDELDGTSCLGNKEKVEHTLPPGELKPEIETAQTDSVSTVNLSLGNRNISQDIANSGFTENRQMVGNGDNQKKALSKSMSEIQNIKKGDILIETTLETDSQLSVNMADVSSVQRHSETCATLSNENLGYSVGQLSHYVGYSDDLGSSVNGEGSEYASQKIEEPSSSQSAHGESDQISEIDAVNEREDLSIKVVTHENENLSIQGLTNEGNEQGSYINKRCPGNTSGHRKEETLKENITIRNVDPVSNVPDFKNDKTLEESNKSLTGIQTVSDLCHPYYSAEDSQSLHSCALKRLLTENEDSSPLKDELNVIAYQIAEDMLNDEIINPHRSDKKQTDISQDLNYQEDSERKPYLQDTEKKDTQHKTTRLAQNDKVTIADIVDREDFLSDAVWHSSATASKELAQKVGVVRKEGRDTSATEISPPVLHTENETKIESSPGCDDEEKRITVAHDTSVDREDISVIHAMFCAPDDVSIESYISPRSNQFVEGDSGYFGEKADSYISSEDFADEIMQRGITMNLRNPMVWQRDLVENTEHDRTRNKVDNYDLSTGNSSDSANVWKDHKSLCLPRGKEKVFLSDYDEEQEKSLEHNLTDPRLNTFNTFRLQTKENDTKLLVFMEEKWDQQSFVLQGDSEVKREKRSSFYDESTTFRYISKADSISDEGLQRLARERKPTLYQPWVNQSFRRIGCHSFQRGSPTALAWNSHFKLTDEVSTTAEKPVECSKNTTEFNTTGKDKLSQDESTFDKDDTEMPLIGKDEMKSEDVKVASEGATGGESAEKKRKGDWLLQLYKGMCHVMSKPDMPYMG